MIGLRLVALDSDAYAGLSWDTGLFTDEGFYLHNARNTVLFGTMRMDAFNNALIMPLLHAVQVGFFRLFGVGLTQTRLISVFASLLTLPLFYAALHRAFGNRAAALGVLFLGLDHTNLLFNRLGLMDTPAVLPLVAAFYAFVRAVEGNEAPLEGAVKVQYHWLIGCGLLLGIAYSVRGLAALLWPVPILVCLFVHKLRPKRGTMVGAILIGLAVALIAYIVCWYLPDAAELARVNRYYIREQLLPRTLVRLGRNLAQALWGTAFPGLLPYLLTHTPVLLGLSLCWFVCSGKKQTTTQRTLGWYLAGWLLTFWLFCAMVNYAPSRYYPMFYPAMAGLAGVTLTCWTETVQASNRWLIAAVAVWGIVNALWLGHWLTHQTYVHRDSSRWLAHNLPPGSVLFGDVAPGLGIQTSFRVINLIPKLCNDDQPLERFPAAPRYIVILDDQKHEKWWGEHYPEYITPARRVYTIPRLIQRRVVVYDATSHRGQINP
jgi:hypothetical protein